MNPWYGATLFLAALIASIAIRVPHERRSKDVQVVQHRRGKLEAMLFALVIIGGVLLPILFLATPVLSFADYPLTGWALGIGVVTVALWLWIFYRSHAELGTNWSVSLEVRQHHRLITSGVYAKIRHPMYTAIFFHALSQALLLANWIAGPAMWIAFTIMFVGRLQIEEDMLRERFGDEYVAYAKRTKRLIPGVW